MRHLCGYINMNMEPYVYWTVNHCEIVLEVSAGKTKYMVISRDRNAGRIQSVRFDNNTFERVEEF